MRKGSAMVLNGPASGPEASPAVNGPVAGFDGNVEMMCGVVNLASHGWNREWTP